MPRNRLQSILFTIMMTLFMVYAMICYNIAIETGGMRNQIFIMAVHELMIMWPAAIIIELLLAGRVAKKLAFRILTPDMKGPIFIILAISTMTVCVMCPVMSLVAVILFKNPGGEFISVWLKTVVFNFPMAFFIQIFLVGPLVRFLFGMLFIRKERAISE